MLCSRALPALQSRRRVGFAACQLGFYQLALTGDNDKKHVGDHQRTEHGAIMDEGAAPTEYMAQPPGGST